MKFAVVVAWHSSEQRDLFAKAWSIKEKPDWLFLERDATRAGCAVTKNRGIKRAYDAGAEVIIVLDDDCFPVSTGMTLEPFAEAHLAALEPTDVQMFQQITSPPSRGTPYFNRTVKMPVAASMGYWVNVGDYDACGQLSYGATHPMRFHAGIVFGNYFPLSGMNFAFRREWWPIPQLIDVARFDDIWMGFLFQKIAYARGYCFNLQGPLVHHSRQSNVWANLRDEAKWLEANETLWQKVHASEASEYDDLRKLLPI